MSKPKLKSNRSTLSTPGNRVRIDSLQVAIADRQKGLEKFVGMYADSHNLKMLFRGTQAMTNGTTIVVPELSVLAREDMTDDEIDAALDVLMCTLGFVYHEGSHVVKSDFKCAARAAKVGTRFKHLNNMLEDIFIEEWCGNTFPGGREALAFTNEWVLGRAALSVKEQTPSLFVQIMYGFSMLGNVHPDALKFPLWRMLEPRARALALKFRSHVMRAKRASNSLEVEKISHEVWEELKDEVKKEQDPPPPEPEDGEPGEPGEPGDDGDEPEDGEDEGGGGGQEDGEDQDGEDQDGPGGGDQDEDGAGEGEDEDDDQGGAGGSQDDDQDEGEDEEQGDGNAPGEPGKKPGKPVKDGDDATAELPGGRGVDEGITDGEEADPAHKPSSLNLDDDPNADKTTDKGDAIADFVREAAKSHLASGGYVYRPYTTENDEISTPEEPEADGERQDLRQAVRELTDSVRSSFGPVTRTLENLLKARTQSYHMRGLEEGRLDPASLHKLASAPHSAQMRDQSRRVFTQKVQAQSLQGTACALTIDMSGSMGSYGGGGYETKDRLAQKCALIFAHALEGVKVPFEITAWSTALMGTSSRVVNQLEREATARKSPHVPCTVHKTLKIHVAECPCCRGSGTAMEDMITVFSLYTRFGGLRVLEIKKFAEQWQHVDWRLTHVRGYQCNYDGESVLLAARRLQARPEKRKVLFVLCDGIPGPEHRENQTVHARYLHEVVKQIRTTTSIELVGIGICAAQAKEFYQPRFVNVTDATTLPKIVAEQLRSVLLLK